MGFYPFQPSGGGGGSVSEVSGGDLSIIATNATGPDVTLETGTLDVIASLHAPAADWSNNSHRITSLEDAISAHQAAAFDQTIAGGAILTTAGDMIYENASPTVARLPVGTSSVDMMGISAGLPAWVQGIQVLASTENSGYALTNGTGAIISWTAPSDGNLHLVFLLGALNVTASDTGGQIGGHYTDVGGNVLDNVLLATSLTTGVQYFNNITRQLLVIKDGVTVSINQDTALSAGTAVLYAAIIGG
jgi:hypothetical protein